MLPMFKEFINFINLKTKDSLYFLEEGYYWYDKSIIKAFDIFGSIVKVARIKIKDDLTFETMVYSNQIFLLEKWEDTVKRNEIRLNELECNSINLIKVSLEKYKSRNKAILSSGGKDSSVTTHLVKKCCLCPTDIEIIFNNTSLDCSDTYRHIKKEENLKIINPKEGFYVWRKKNNFIPTRFARACCSIFKEQAMVNELSSKSEYLFYMGMRNEESETRSDYKDYWKNKKWNGREWGAILPIRRWSELDIWLYILKEKIDINPKYKKGYSRVGCAIACPFYGKLTWSLDEYFYPTLTQRWRKILREDFVTNNKDLILNCTEEEYIFGWNGGPLRDSPTEKVIEEFSQRHSLEYNIAKNYFNHNCEICDKKIKNKDVISVNLKVNGRNIEKMYCKNHLMQNLNINKNEWNVMISNFKQQGCSLF